MKITEHVGGDRYVICKRGLVQTTVQVGTVTDGVLKETTLIATSSAGCRGLADALYRVADRIGRNQYDEEKEAL